MGMKRDNGKEVDTGFRVLGLCFGAVGVRDQSLGLP